MSEATGLDGTGTPTPVVPPRNILSNPVGTETIPPAPTPGQFSPRLDAFPDFAGALNPPAAAPPLSAPPTSPVAAGAIGQSGWPGLGAPTPAQTAAQGGLGTAGWQIPAQTAAQSGLGTAGWQIPAQTAAASGLGQSGWPMPSTANAASNAPPSAANNNIALGQVIYPNTLAQYFSVVPYWRFFMLPDQDLFGANVTSGAPSVGSALDLYAEIDRMPQVILTETGVTEYNLREITFESLVSSNAETRAINSTKFTMTVVEPMSVGFLDGIRDAVVQLGINNVQMCPYYLELQFKAYDKAGNFIPNACAAMVPPLPNGGRWIWSVQITNIDVHLDAAGGTYTITGVFYTESVMADDLMRTPTTIQATGNTVQQLLDSYMTELTNYYKVKYPPQNGGLPYYTFNPIVWHPANLNGVSYDPRPWVVTKDPHNPSSRLDMTNSIPTLTVEMGTNIGDVLDAVMANQAEAQAAAGATPPSNTGQAVGTSTGSFPERIIYRIEPDVKITGYDRNTNRYSREFTFHVRGSYKQFPTVNPTDAQNANNPGVQAAMLQAYIKNGCIHKQYDYLYTGLNTEVLDFNIGYNMAWAAILPGLLRYGSVAVPRLANPLTTSPTDGNLGTAPTAASASPASVGVTGSVAPSAATPSGAIPPSAMAGPSGITNPAQTAAASGLGITGWPGAPPPLTPAQTAAASGIGQAGWPGSRVYVGDLVKQDVASNAASGTNPLLTAYLVGHRLPDISAGTGMGDGNYDYGQSVFGAVLAQDNLAKQFMSIDLEIRGDPFWLGQSNLERQVIMRSGQAPVQTASSAIPDFYFGEQLFLLTFRYPTSVDENTFMPQFVGEATFSGFYQVVKIDQKFVEGQFRQVLHARRMPRLTISQAMGGAATSAATATGGAVANLPTTSPSTGTATTPTVPPAGTTATPSTAAAATPPSGQAQPSTTTPFVYKGDLSQLGSLQGGGSIGESSQCVALVKSLTGAPQTSQWTAGQSLADFQNNPSAAPIGAAIATFNSNGVYTNSLDGTSHAAILTGADANGITIFNQYAGSGPHYTTYPWSGPGSFISSGSNYSVIAHR